MENCPSNRTGMIELQFLPHTMNESFDDPIVSNKIARGTKYILFDSLVSYVCSMFYKCQRQNVVFALVRCTLGKRISKECLDCRTFKKFGEEECWRESLKRIQEKENFFM